MLSGCGEKEIAGQIFVVTQGKDNIKLALVTVGAIPLEEFDQYLKVPRQRGFGNEEYFIKNLPQPKFISKTDADGKFTPFCQKKVCDNSKLKPKYIWFFRDLPLACLC